jgi:hypothetical protein
MIQFIESPINMVAIVPDGHIGGIKSGMVIEINHRDYKVGAIDIIVSRRKNNYELRRRVPGSRQGRKMNDGPKKLIPYAGAERKKNAKPEPKPEVLTLEGLLIRELTELNIRINAEKRELARLEKRLESVRKRRPWRRRFWKH